MGRNSGRDYDAGGDLCASPGQAFVRQNVPGCIEPRDRRGGSPPVLGRAVPLLNTETEITRPGSRLG